MEDALLVSQFAAGAGFLVLAAGLLAVRFNSRINRAFAIYLLLHGGAILTLAGARRADGQTQEALLAFLPHLVLPLPFALLYFLAVYQTPHGGRWPRVTGIGALAATVLVNGAYLLDPCLAFCAGDGATRAGPLAPIYHATPLMQAMVAIALAREAAKQGARTRAMRVVATAFAMLAFVEGSLIVTLFLSGGLDGFTTGHVANAWGVMQRAVGLLAFGASGVAFWLLGRSADNPRRLAFIGGLAFATAVAVNSFGPIASAGQEAVPQALVALWRLFAATLVAYALIRHRFLALDEAVSATIRKGTVVTVLVATFLIVFQIAENALDERLGWIFGGLATGLMLLAARPVERLGHRIAHVVVPRADHGAAHADERLQLFHEQAFMVWSDGVMGRKERLLLDHLRERLRIPAGIASQIEHEAAVAAPKAASNPRILSTSPDM